MAGAGDVLCRFPARLRGIGTGLFPGEARVNDVVLYELVKFFCAGAELLGTLSVTFLVELQCSPAQVFRAIAAVLLGLFDLFTRQL